MSKKLLITTIVLFFTAIIFISPIPISAETNSGIMPNSFLYFFDTSFEKINLFFTFAAEKKAEKALLYADERISEAEEMVDENKPRAVIKALAGYREKIAFVVQKTEDVRSDVDAETLFIAIKDNITKHQEVLESVMEKVPHEAKDAIIHAIEVSKREKETAVKLIVEVEERAKESKRIVEEAKERIEELGKRKEKISPPIPKTKYETLKLKVFSPKDKPTGTSILTPPPLPSDTGVGQKQSIIQSPQQPSIDVSSYSIPAPPSLPFDTSAEQGQSVIQTMQQQPVETPDYSIPMPPPLPD